MSLFTPTDHDVIVGCGDHSTGFYKDLLARCVPLMQNFATSAFALNIVRSLQDQKRRIFDSKYNLLSREEAVDYVARDLIHYSTSHRSSASGTQSSLRKCISEQNNNTTTTSSKNTAETSAKLKSIAISTSPAKAKKRMKAYACRMVRAVCRASRWKKSTVLSSIQVLDVALPKHIETLSERKLRNQLRQRYFAVAAAAGMSIEAFSTRYLEQIGCHDPAAFTQPRPRKKTEKKKGITSPDGSSLSIPATTTLDDGENDSSCLGDPRTSLSCNPNVASAHAEGNPFPGVQDRQIAIPDPPMAEADTLSNIYNNSSTFARRGVYSPIVAPPALISETNGSQVRDHGTSALSDTTVAKHDHVSNANVSTVRETPCSFESSLRHPTAATTTTTASVTLADPSISVNTTSAVQSKESDTVYPVRYPLGDLELVALVD